MQVVRKNFALKVLALTLAIVGWAYFRFTGNPLVATPEFQQLSIPIVAVNLPVGYVARFTDREADVTVATKHGEAPVKPEQIKAVLDLAQKGAGVYNVPVQLVAPDVVVQSLSPASVTLTIERIEQRSYPISVNYVGAQPSGVVVSYSAIGPDVAILQGATSVLAQVSAVRADVTMPSQPQEVDEMIRPSPVDASGVPVAGVSVTPTLVRVRIRFVAGSSKTK